MASKKNLGKTSVSSGSSGSSGIGVLANPLTIDGIADENPPRIPPAASTVGATLRIPPWAASTKAGVSDRLEVWVLEPDATIEVLFYDNLFPVPVTFPPSVLLPAQYLQRFGMLRLRYRVTLGDNDNEDTSLPQTFAVSPQYVINLPKPKFTVESSYQDLFPLNGYLNCRVRPRIWERVLLHIPAQIGRYNANDELILDWKGFLTLNGQGPIIVGTEGKFTKTLTQAEASSPTGFMFVVGSDKYVQHIQPIPYGSVKAFYTVYRIGIPLGSSSSDTVKIDRKLPGGELCDANLDPFP